MGIRSWNMQCSHSQGYADTLRLHLEELDSINVGSDRLYECKLGHGSKSTGWILMSGDILPANALIQGSIGKSELP